MVAGDKGDEVFWFRRVEEGEGILILRVGVNATAFSDVPP